MKKDQPQFWIHVLTIWVLLEFVISPHPHTAKNLSVFPSFQLLRFTFDISEFLILLTIGVAVAGYFARFVIVGSVRITLLRYSRFLLLLVVLSLFSAGFGVVFGNPDALGMVRTTIAVPVLLVIVFVFFSDRNVPSVLYREMYVVGVCIAFLNILILVNHDLFGPVLSYYPDETAIRSKWVGLYLSVFSFAVSYSTLILRGTRFRDVGVVAVVTASVALNLTHKPIVLAYLVVVLTINYFALFSIRGQRRAVVIGLQGFIVLAVVLAVLPAHATTDLVRTIGVRFLKQDISTVSELPEAFRSAELGGSNDISGGRIAIWRSYLRETRSGPVLSSNFGNRPEVDFGPDSYRENQFLPSHNLIVHYAYHAGIISGVAVFFMLIGFTVLSLAPPNVRRRLLILENGKRESGLGKTAFVLAVFAAEMFGGPILQLKFAWVFALVLVSSIQEIEFLRSYQRENRDIARVS